ncbi:MAG: aminodeoxychorismate/anthranilate synthase component II [Pseudomonadota bacterium]|jgi:anthranilate synthase component 2|nr:aminodeoxychorismate/anthranilate synthase component II [Pseudomonadota bacterium]
MSDAKSILVIDNYDSFTWNLVHYLEEIGARTQVVRNDEISVDAALALKPDGIVLSPGPCTPNEAGICVELVQKAPDDLPILGVCLGHQSIGAAEGGKIITAQQIRHGKISQIRHENGPLFDGLPESYDVVRYHSLSIRAEDLPETLIADAFTADGEIMAVRHKTRPVYGVQFHPESILTEHGHALLRNWLEL